MNNKVTYRQQYTRCGKQRCRKCKEGEGHGPYWYAYWSEKGRTVSKYIGSHLPDEVTLLSDTPVPHKETPEGAPQGATQPQPSGPILRVYLLGQFRIERRNGAEWSPIDSRAWHRRRARALLGCLLSNPGRRLGREQVMELLWPDLDVDVAANRLNGAVHELRQILEPDITRPAASRLLRLERDILELADNTLIWIDAEAFEALLKEANAATAAKRTEQLLEEAHALYKGSYLLEELYSEWAAPRRDALQRAWVGLQLDLANVRIEVASSSTDVNIKQGAYRSAIETLDRLRTAEPTNETALQRLMALLTQLDRRGEALQVYRQHVTMLQRDYESEPLPETAELYDALRKGHVPAIITSPLLMQRTITASDQSETQSVGATQDDMLAPPQQPSPFMRPIFQIGRINQSPLIGREHELAIMQQVMLSVENLHISVDHTAPTGKAEREHMLPLSVGTRVAHFLLVQGEAGIGKTRLAEELSLEAYDRSWAVAWSRSYEQEGTIPYRPWTELLRTLLGGGPNQTDLSNIAALVENKQSLTPLNVRLERLIALLPELANHPVLSQLRASSPLPYEQERLHLWEAALWLLEALSNSQPLLLVLDDLHWSDDSSIDLLTYLTHHFNQQPILIVATCRDGELPAQHKLRTLIADLRREQTSATITLQPLTSSQIGSLVAHLPSDMVTSIQTQSAGNPFFAEELARYINTTQNADTTAASLPFHDAATAGSATHPTRQQAVRGSSSNQRLLPEAIAAVLERRMSRLSNNCHTLLSKAAVFGGSFELRQLLPMASEYDEDTLLDLLEEALQAGLLTEEGTGAHITYFFWHPLIISHLYDRLSAARRAQLHRKVAEAIKAMHVTFATSSPEKSAAAIVYHLSKGGGDPAQIAYYAELAGNQAYTLAAYSEVQQYYLQAIQATTGQDLLTPELPEPRTYIPIVCSYLVSTPFLSRPLHICRLLEHIAACSMLLGNSAEARQVYECILQLRTSQAFVAQAYPLDMNTDERHVQEAQIQALLWREIGNTWTATGDYPRAQQCYLQGKEVLHAASITTGPAWACLHLQYGALLRLEGNYLEARRYLEEALHMLENSIQQDVPEHLPSSARVDNELPTRIERALSGDPLETGYAHERLGIVLASVGQLNDALEHFQVALKIFERCELVSEMGRVNGNLGVAYATKGDHRVGREYMQRSLNLAERTGDLPNMAFILGNLGDMAHRSGNLLEAESWFQRSLEFAERIHDRERISWFHVELARVQQDLGKLQEAAASLYRAIITGRAIHSNRCIGYALVGLGNLRLVGAITTNQLFSSSANVITQPSSYYRRLLLRAKATLQRAISLEGLEVESILEGTYLLATIHLLLNEFDQAYEISMQTLKMGQENELTRMSGRINRLLGHILSAQGKHTEADSYFQLALDINRAHEMHLEYARALYGYGLSLLMRSPHSSMIYTPHRPPKSVEIGTDSYTRGVQLLQDARSVFVECHAQTDLTWLAQILSACEPAIPIH